MSTTLILGAIAFGMLDLHTGGLRNDQAFRGKPESVVGQNVLQQSFPPGASAPAQVLANADAVPQVVAAMKATPGVYAVLPPGAVYRGRVEIDAILTAADGSAANHAVDALRARLHAIPGADAKVGGQAATTLDINRASVHDRKVVIPIVLVVVFVILGLLLRALGRAGGADRDRACCRS